jgi:hypothetical protein
MVLEARLRRLRLALRGCRRLQPRFADSRRTRSFSSRLVGTKKPQTNFHDLRLKMVLEARLRRLQLALRGCRRLQPRFADSRRTRSFSSRLVGTKKPQTNFHDLRLKMVLEARFELAQPCGHKALNLACLPISPPERVAETGEEHTQ